MAAELEKDLALEIAHLLFIDVVGYSKLLVNEQIELIQQLNRIVRGTDSFRAAEANEKMIRLPTGDGMVLLFFRSPEQPVRCALQISQALRDRPQIKIRMGIHSGPVNQVTDVNDQINMAGAGINIGQRVMDCGDAGHILLSGHVAGDLAQYRHWQPHLHDLGECEVKHGVRLHLVNLHKDGLGNSAIPENLKPAKRWKQTKGVTVWPVNGPPKSLGIIALLLAGIALATSCWILLRGASETTAGNPDTPIPEKSVAVLPFENRSEEKANAYFADGIQDEILTRLSKIADLKVISRTSTQHYKSAPENLPEIARQLRVAYILEGSVQKIGETVRINVQLIRAATDSHVWADTFDRKLIDIFSVETEVAKAIAEQLRAKLSGQEEQVIAAKPTDNPEAYDAYLRGLAYTLKAAVTPGNTLGAQNHLREAVRLDPKFALSWALLSYVDSASYGALDLQPTAALREEARQAAETALALQPNLGEGLYAKGYYHYACLKDYDSAVRYFEQARRFLPNSSLVPTAFAYVARRQRQWERSESYFNEAERLDPRNVQLLTQHALSYVMHRQFPKAWQKLDRVLEITPGEVSTLALQAAIAQGEGDLPRAAALLTPLQPTAEEVLALEQQVYQAILERRPAQMIARLQEVLAKPDPALGFNNGELRFWLGWAQEVAGDRDGARESWRQARAELEPFVKDQSQNHVLIYDLALVHMGLGDKAAALALSERAATMTSVQRMEPLTLEVAARIAARLGEADRAIVALEKLLTMPYEGALASGVPLTPALLRLDPMFDSLRGDPRFEKLGAPSPKSEPNTP